MNKGSVLKSISIKSFPLNRHIMSHDETYQLRTKPKFTAK